MYTKYIVSNLPVVLVKYYRRRWYQNTEIKSVFSALVCSHSSKTMVLDGYLEIGAHVRNNLCYLIFVRHLNNSRAVTNLIFSPKILVFLYACVTCSELPSTIGTMIHSFRYIHEKIGNTIILSLPSILSIILQTNPILDHYFAVNWLKNYFLGQIWIIRNEKISFCPYIYWHPNRI